MDQLQQGGGGSQATVVFTADNFFEVMVYGDRALDFSNLQPSSFGVVQDFIEGNHNLTPDTYSLSEISQHSNADAFTLWADFAREMAA